MTDRTQDQQDSILRLQEATKALREAQAGRPERRWWPTQEEHDAEAQWKQAIADARKTDVLPTTIAKYAEAPVEDILSILYDFGLAPEYEPLAQREIPPTDS
jgi:hypothetical protein